MIEEQKIEKYFIKNELDIQRILSDYYSYIKTIIRNNANISLEDQEEIISDIVFIIWKNKDKLDKKKKFSPYISGITRKIVYKKFSIDSRKVQTTDITEEIEKDYVSDFNVENLIEEKDVNEYILKNLENTEAEMFRKFYFEDKSIKQIAKEMKLTKSNVKTKLHRVRKKVKEFLKIGGF